MQPDAASLDHRPLQKHRGGRVPATGRKSANPHAGAGLETSFPVRNIAPPAGEDAAERTAGKDLETHVRFSWHGPSPHATKHSDSPIHTSSIQAARFGQLSSVSPLCDQKTTSPSSFMQ